MRAWLRPRVRLFLFGYWDRRGYGPETVWPMPWWQQAITGILWPHVWYHPDDVVVDYCVNRCGVTEADIRDFRWLMNKDVIVVRLWNWRQLEINGLEFDVYQIRRWPR